MQGGLTLEGSIPFILMAGKILSALAILLVLLAIWNVWRRKFFPGVSYGGITISRRRLRWVWFLVLAGGFAFGVNEDPTAVSTRSLEDPEEQAAATSFKTVSLNLPLPFYRFERERVYGDGELVGEEVLEGFVIPGPLISALIAYLFLVVRWDSSSRIARRILQGRKWEKEEVS